MAHRHHAPLWVLLLLAIPSLPARAVPANDAMTPVPAATWLAALGPEQTVPDAACAAKCAADRDRSIAWADTTLAAKDFYSGFSSNCTEEKGQPKCTALREACVNACAPKFEASCMSACNVPFQSCCHANKVAWEHSRYESCVAACPTRAVPPPPALPTPPPPPVRNPLADASKQTDAALGLALASSWGKATLVAWEAYQATRPAADVAADNVRRAEAFNEVRSGMAQSGASFALVSGGGGRLWLLRPNGETRLLSIDDTAYFRSGAPNADLSRDLAMAPKMGLSADEFIQVVLTAKTWPDFGTDFKSGQVLRFIPGQSGGQGAPVRKGSSEHTSIRGTINGGGDFI